LRAGKALGDTVEDGRGRRSALPPGPARGGCAPRDAGRAAPRL